MTNEPMRVRNPKDSARSREDPNARDAPGGLSQRRSGGGRRRSLLRPVLVVCAVMAGLVAADYWANAGEIYRGVEVAGVSLGGKTPEEARALVEERVAGMPGEVRFTGGPEEFALTTGEMGVNYDVAGTVEEAYAVGRRGGVLERIDDRLGAAWGSVDVPPTVDYEEEAARAEIENRAKRVYEEPRDAYVSVSGTEAEAVESREGYEVDVETTVANLEGALESMSGEAELAGEVLEPAVLTPAAEEAAGRAQETMDGPLTLSSGGRDWELPPEGIGQALSFAPQEGEIRVSLDREQLRDILSDVYDTLNVEPVEAGFKVEADNKVSVTESRTGKKIEEEKLFDEIEAGLFGGTREYEIPVATAEPGLTTQEAERLKPTKLLGQYRTNYTLTSDKSPERVENLDIASGAISGRFLAPGEVFSVNEVAAPLSYNSTKVIIGGREEHADGGGLCQVSSTLYMAANYAGLEIVERHPHSAQLPYIRPGLDATVWFGALDMKFKNTTDGYVLLQEWVGDDGYIYASVYGRPTGKEVEMDSEPLYLGSDYSEWVTYQKVTDENGEVVFDGVLHEDTYQPLVDEKGTVIPPNSGELNIAPVNY